MKKALIVLGIFCLIILLATILEGRLNKASEALETMAIQKEQAELHRKEAEEKVFADRMTQKAEKAFAYAKEKGFDLEHAFLIDFNIHSGKNRFFVWDFNKKNVIYTSLCAHGAGKANNKSTYTDIKYSNVEGSLLSSLGKYKIGERSYSNYGINVHYKLHGLEKSNNNAFKRIVVLHSYGLVPAEEIYPRHIPLGYSQGCPVIDDRIMLKVDKMLQNKNKPVLLWIYK